MGKDPVTNFGGVSIRRRSNCAEQSSTFGKTNIRSCAQAPVHHCDCLDSGEERPPNTEGRIFHTLRREIRKGAVPQSLRSVAQ
jgi:hypothetical protein